VSTSQGCAQRTAGGGRRALTRAERRGCASPRMAAGRSDCSRIFGLVDEAISAPGHHGNPRAGRQSLARPLMASRVIGVAPRRSDRCAMMRGTRCSSLESSLNIPSF
jgi:hypothetical protein